MGLTFTKLTALSAAAVTAMGFICMPQNFSVSEAAVTSFTERTDHEANSTDCGYSVPLWIYAKPGKTWTVNLTSYSLLLIDIGAYSSGINEDHTDYDLDEAFFTSLENALKNARKNDVTLGIRMRYDSNGTQNPEPETFDKVLYHVEQLGKSGLLDEYEDVITFVETGMVGAYGEQWGGKYVSLPHKAELLNKFLEITPESIPVLVRTPNIMREWLKTYCGITTTAADMSYSIKDENLAAKARQVGLFNDGYMGSDSDLGTYSNRQGETQWLSETTLYGGEFSGDDGWRMKYDTWLPQNAVPEMYKTNLSRINCNIFKTKKAVKIFKTKSEAQSQLDTVKSLYEKAGIDYSKAEADIIQKAEGFETSWLWPGYDAFEFNRELDELLGLECDNSAFYGQDVYQFIRAHLGYRYVLRTVDISEKADPGKTFSINFTADNTGFADSPKDKETEVILTNGHLTYSFDTSVNPKNWHSGTRNEEQININLPSDIPGGDWEVYLRISGLNEEEKYDTYRCVKFANEEISYNSELGANLIGSINISGTPDPYAGGVQNMRPAGYYPEEIKPIKIDDETQIQLLDKNYTFKEDGHYGFTFLYKADGLTEKAQLGNWLLSFSNSGTGYSSAYTTYGLNTMNLTLEENGYYALNIPFFSAVFNFRDAAQSGAVLTGLNINDSKNYWSADTFTKINGNKDFTLTPLAFIEGSPEGYNVTLHLESGDKSYTGSYGFEEKSHQTIKNIPAVTVFSLIKNDMPSETEVRNGKTYKFIGFTTKRDDKKYIIDENFIAIGDTELYPYYEIISSEENNILRGDVNGDGIVDRNDLNLLKQYMTNQKKSIISENADMDGNGKTDILDYVLLSSLFSEESGGKNKKSK